VISCSLLQFTRSVDLNVIIVMDGVEGKVEAMHNSHMKTTSYTHIPSYTYTHCIYTSTPLHTIEVPRLQLIIRPRHGLNSPHSIRSTLLQNLSQPGTRVDIVPNPIPLISLRLTIRFSQ
jgi:hypothetical protein